MKLFATSMLFSTRLFIVTKIISCSVVIFAIYGNFVSFYWKGILKFLLKLNSKFESMVFDVKFVWEIFDLIYVLH